MFSGVSSNYEALVAEYKRRMTHHISLDANYTWSHALDYGENNQTGAAVESLLDPANIRLDYGNSNQNVPSRLVIYTVGESPWHAHGALGYLVNDFELSPSFQTQSGLPYSPGINISAASLYPAGSTTQKALVVTSFNGSNSTGRLPNIDRNAFRYPKTWNLDLRFSKRFTVREHYSLEYLAEAFNLANHQNVTGLGTTAYSVTEDTTNHINTLTPYTAVTYNSITSTNNSNFAYNVRQIQMALRLTF